LGPNAHTRDNTNSPSPSVGSGVGGSRISSLASLFGVKPSTPPQIRTPPPGGSPSASGSLTSGVGLVDSPVLDSQDPSASQSPLTSAIASTASIDIQAYTITRQIVRDEVGEGIGEGVKGEIRAALLGSRSSVGSGTGEELGSEAGHGVPGWVAEKVIEFVEHLLPFVAIDRNGKDGARSVREKSMGVGMALVAGKGAGKGKSVFGGKEKRVAGEGKYSINLFGETMEELSTRFQDFYGVLEGDLRAAVLSSSLGVGREPVGKWDGDAEMHKDEGKDEDEERERRESKEEEAEARVREVMEVVEKFVCVLFYDRWVSLHPIHPLPFLLRIFLRIYPPTNDHPRADSSSNQPQTIQRMMRLCPVASQRLTCLI
jgi:hypothetical protein